MKHFRAADLLFPIAALLLPATGCADSDGRQEVSGTVTLKGQPLDEGFIEFHPLGEAPKDQLVTRSGAMITGGKYLISQAEGLVPGQYRVVISSGDTSAPLEGDGGPGPKSIFSKERIPADYNSATRQVVEVKPDGSNTFDYVIP
jgi:hypothetical protein